jgi:hypothetical protein
MSNLPDKKEDRAGRGRWPLQETTVLALILLKKAGFHNSFAVPSGSSSPVTAAAITTMELALVYGRDRLGGLQGALARSSVGVALPT